MATEASRPLLLAVIAIVIGIQAVFSILFGIGLYIERNDNDLLAHVAQSSDELGALGIGAIVVGVIQLLVAAGLWSGNNFARLLTGFFAALQLMAGIYVLIAYDGALRWQGLWQSLLGALVLYLLFNRSADRFFTSR